MSVLTRAIDVLRSLELDLAQQPAMAGGETSLQLAERIRDVRRLLSGDDAQWIGTTEAKRLLGVGSENTVKAWARAGRLRSRTQPDGRIQVLLDDVLGRREVVEGLTAIDIGEDISQEELDQLMRNSPPLYPGGPGYRRGQQSEPPVLSEAASAR